jgi:mannose-6-phosphate isomerase-like protein (cupin superfamily)
MNVLSLVPLFFAVVAVAWTTAYIVGQFRPEPQAPDSLYPKVGQFIHSRAEGFTSQIIKTDSDYTWLELTLAPHAPGPPPHVHTRFAEHFVVAKGTLSLRVGNEVKVLHAGEDFRVPPGVVHQPFNPTDEKVVVRGPLTLEYALPRGFVLFLSQVYGFIDESPKHGKPPAVLFQMSIFSPRYDSWLAKPPLGVQRAGFTLLRPIARLLGYRSYYARFVPGSTAATD